MFHPVAFVSGTFAERLDAFQGPWAPSCTARSSTRPTPARGFLRGFQLQLCRDGGPLMTALGASPSTSSPGGRGTTRPSGSASPTPSTSA